MDTYETIFISVSDLTQEKIEANVEKVKQLIASAEGKILALELWGRRKLSYPIKRNRDGFYVYLLHTSPPTIPAVLDRHFRLTETILRSLTVKVDPRYLEKVRASSRSGTGEATHTALPPEAPPRTEEGEATHKKENLTEAAAAEEVRG